MEDDILILETVGLKSNPLQTIGPKFAIQTIVIYLRKG